MTASGGIAHGHMAIGKLVVGFLCFKEARVQLFHYDLGTMTSEEAGKAALKDMGKIPKLAGVAVLANFDTVNIADFLEPLDELPPAAAIFGGGADTYKSGEKTFVFGNHYISERGIVAVCFSGALEIMTCMNLGWQPLGKVMTITATDGNRVIKELDHEPAFRVYARYLKLGDAASFRSNVLTFPILLRRNGRLLARLPESVREDGSLVMAGECFTGEQVRLAYGDPTEIIERSSRNGELIRAFAPEGILMISCITRRRYLGEDTNRVLKPYGEIAPSCGGYSHGEIIRFNGKPSTLNMTLVVAAFRENGNGKGPCPVQRSSGVPNIVFNNETMTVVQRLASFISVSTAELEEANRKLEVANRKLEEANRKLAYLASHDGLTGLLNRERIESILSELNRNSRTGGPAFSAIMIDLDNFKQINDTLGHGEGDRVLVEMAQVFQKMIPAYGEIGRWGGDEFVILLPGTGEIEARNIAEQLRKTIPESVRRSDRLPVFASFGVAQVKAGESAEAFYRRVDTALYRAKFQGKNSIHIV